MPLSMFKQMSRDLRKRRQEEQELIARNAARNNAHTTNSASSSAQNRMQQQAERQLGADQVAPAPSAIPVAVETRERSRSAHGITPEPAINIQAPAVPARGDRSSSPVITTTNNTEEKSRSRSPAVLISRLKHGEGGATSVVPVELQIGEPERFNIGSDKEDTPETAEKTGTICSKRQAREKNEGCVKGVVIA